MRCRHCEGTADLLLVDLGSSPPSNAYLTEVSLRAPETWFPLRVMVCESCWLVQTEESVDPSRLFSDEYAYFSGFSSTWIEHCRHYADQIIEKLQLGPSSRVIEVACNDGTLLEMFQERGIQCTGIEPTASTARSARDRGLEVVEVFLTTESAAGIAASGTVADLLVANNVLAHVPDISGFATGCANLLSDNGVASFEFQYLVELVTKTQFDTIYHEHYTYLSLRSVETVFEAAGLAVFDVEELPTHGGSLRVYAQRADSGRHRVKSSVHRIRSEEEVAGVASPSFYAGFQTRAERIKDQFLLRLREVSADGQRIGGYGAAAKGNTLLNYAGINSDLLPYVVDNNPMKVGKYLPGSRIPVVSERVLVEDNPEVVLVLPWNLEREVTSRLRDQYGWNGSIMTPMSDSIHL